MTKKGTKGTIKVKQVYSAIGAVKSQIATLRGLGLRKINNISELQDTPAVRGMITKVKHLVVVL